MATRANDANTTDTVACGARTALVYATPRRRAYGDPRLKDSRGNAAGMASNGGVVEQERLAPKTCRDKSGSRTMDDTFMRQETQCDLKRASESRLVKLDVWALGTKGRRYDIGVRRADSALMGPGAHA